MGDEEKQTYGKASKSRRVMCAVCGTGTSVDHCVRAFTTKDEEVFAHDECALAAFRLASAVTNFGEVLAAVQISAFERENS